MNLSGNGQIADFDSWCGTLCGMAGPVLRKFKAVGKKEGNAAVSDNPLLERVAAVGEDCHLTSEFAFGQIVLRMNGQKPLSVHKRVRITSGSGMISENHRITC
jgi:hypothetical protein